MFKYTGSLVCFSINAGCSSFLLYVCTGESNSCELHCFLWPRCYLGTSPESMECYCSINWVGNLHMFPSSSVTAWNLHSLFHYQSLAHFQNHHHLPPGFQPLSSRSVPLMKLMLPFQPVLDPRMTQN